VVVVKIFCFCMMVFAFLQGSVQAQSGPAETKSGENQENLVSLVTGLPAQPKNDVEPYHPTSTQRFVCNGGYTQKECHEEVTVLRKALERYPVGQLGNWTWVLVRSEDWKALVGPRGLDPDSPAFTFPPKRETFVEQALVTQVAVRNRELLLKWNMGNRDLLDVAVRHELGHALCNDPSEQSADRVASLLQQNKPINCDAMSKRKSASRE
jgi:hypothetical protein